MLGVRNEKSRLGAQACLALLSVALEQAVRVGASLWADGEDGDHKVDGHGGGEQHWHEDGSSSRSRGEEADCGGVEGQTCSPADPTDDQWDAPASKVETSHWLLQPLATVACHVDLLLGVDHIRVGVPHPLLHRVDQLGVDDAGADRDPQCRCEDKVLEEEAERATQAEVFVVDMAKEQMKNKQEDEGDPAVGKGMLQLSAHPDPWIAKAVHKQG